MALSQQETRNQSMLKDVLLPLDTNWHGTNLFLVKEGGHVQPKPRSQPSLMS